MPPLKRLCSVVEVWAMVWRLRNTLHSLIFFFLHIKTFDHTVAGATSNMIKKTVSTTFRLLPNRLLQPAHPAALGAEAVRQYCDFVFLCRWQGCHDDDPQDLACGKLRVACAPLWVVSINGPWFVASRAATIAAVIPE